MCVDVCSCSFSAASSARVCVFMHDDDDDDDEGWSSIIPVTGIIQCTSCPLLILNSAHSVFFLPLFFSQIIFDNVEMQLFSRTIRFIR